MLRRRIVKLVEKRYIRSIAGMVAQLLRKSVVFTKGDEPGRTEEIDQGLAQVGPSSPLLFNIVMDTLIFLGKRRAENCAAGW